MLFDTPGNGCETDTMKAMRVCAIIITYHPSEEMVENLSALRTQVDGLVVVDNGSNPEELHGLSDALNKDGLHLIENHENLGIAEALNYVLDARA
jgi:rhamnosyltransferase